MESKSNARRADLIIHPVRLQIVSELCRSPLTPRQLGQFLPHIPQSTLYRHISLLFEGGVLEVVAENTVNGVTERTYGLVRGQANIGPEEFVTLSPTQHIDFFTLFATSLIENFSEYIKTCNLNEALEDGLSYNRAVVYLSPEERNEFRQALGQALQPIMSNQPAANRQRFTLASIVIPDAKPEKAAADEEETGNAEK